MNPSRGGASDAFKRAAVLAGIGRYLYRLKDEQWVSLDQYGKIAPADRARLDAYYIRAMAKMFPGVDVGTATVPSGQKTTSAREKTPQPKPSSRFTITYLQPTADKQRTKLVLQDDAGTKYNALLSHVNQCLRVGAILDAVEMSAIPTQHGPLYKITNYQARGLSQTAA